MHLREILNFVRDMYDENYAERWEAGMKPFSNEWEYLTKNQNWLEKEFYHKEARDWRKGTVWDLRRQKNDAQIRHENKIFLEHRDGKINKSVSELLQEDLEPIDNMVDEGGPVWSEQEMDYSGAFESDVNDN